VSRAISIAALLTAGTVALGGLAAACASVDNEPRAKVTVTQAAPAKNTPPPKPDKPSEPIESVAEANARASAKSYLETGNFSRKGLIEQLKYEGYSTADATYGVGAVSVDWNDEAAESAKSYLETGSFSRSGLIEQLKYEGFTESQAVYGVNQTGL
jgi:hypothetical protein